MKFAISLLAVASVSAFISPSIALAQTANASSESNDEDGVDESAIVVTATRFDTPLDQIGRSVSVITSEQIEDRQQRFVYDTLTAVPGVQVIRSGSFGALSSVSLRGLPSDQTLVVQDGIVINDPASFGNGFNFNAFDTADIERIEVLRGAQSTLYGSDAIGGVINIITKTGVDGLSGNGFVEAGSFGTLRGAASLLGGSEIASGRITVSGVTTSGFSSADEANGNTENDGFDNITISGRGTVNPTSNLKLEGIVRYQDNDSEFDGFDFATGAADADEVALNESLNLAGIVTHTAFNGGLENRFSITYLNNDRLNLSDGEPSFDAVGTRISYEYQAKITPLDALSFIAGIEHDEQESEVEVGFGGNQEIETTSFFGLIQTQPLDFLTLNAGIRHDSSPDFSDETTFSVSGVVNIEQSGTLVRGSFAEGFRAPTAGEFSFNPNLFAEFSEGWDIGIEQRLLDDRVRVTLTYFDQEIDDLIAFDLAAFTFVNIQEFSSEGVELAVDVQATDWLTINAAYTYVDAVNLSTEIAAGNQPEDRVSIEFLAQPTNALTLSLGLNYNGEEQDGAVTLDDFFLVNLRASYAITDTFEVFGRIENLTDEEYQDNFGFGTAPLSAFGGVRARF